MRSLERLVVLLVVVGLCAAEKKNETIDPELLEIDENYKKMFEDLTQNAVKQFLPIFSEIIYDAKLSTTCASALMKFGMAMRSPEIWAIQMIDASGKPPSGLLYGRLADYGNYEECLDVKHPQNSFQGQYCMLHLEANGKITPRMNMYIDYGYKYAGLHYIGNVSGFLQNEHRDFFPLFKLGVCIPSTCSKEDLQFILDVVLGRHKIDMTAKWCETRGPVQIDRKQATIIGIFSIWIFFLICGTGYDLCKSLQAKAESRFSTKPQKPGLLSKVLMGFSLRRAALKLTSVPNWGDYSNELGFVHGMRVFSATWVIQGHHYVLRDIHHNSDMLLFLRRIQSFLFSMQINAFMAVGSFFIITGFLSGYLMAKTPLRKTPAYLLVLFVLVRRYIRLIPSMLALLGVIYLFPLLMSGPYLKDNKLFNSASCDANWWRILTMTQNQVHSLKDLCMPHYWYVSVDFQLAIFSSIILIMIMPRWPKLGLGIMGAIVVATSIATAAVTYAHNYLPLPLILTSRLKSIFDTNLDVYMKTYPQAPSVFTGIIFGYLAAQPRKLPRKVQAICWTLAALLACSALFGVHTWHRGRAPERLESAFYAGFHRLSWAVGVSWVMYACATGRGGPVNKLLSWPLFYPLSRLSLAVYIVHILLFSANAIVSRERKSYMPFIQGQDLISATIMAYFFGAIVYLCVECPVAALDNLMFGGVKAKQDGDKDVAKQNEIQELKSVHATTNGVVGHIGSSALTNGHSNGHPIGHSNGHSVGYVKYEDPIYDPPERDSTVGNRKADEDRSAVNSTHQSDAGESDSAVTVKF